MRLLYSKGAAIMKMLRAKVLLPAVCTSLLFLLPTAVSAAESTATTTAAATTAPASTAATTPPSLQPMLLYQTNVGGLLVWGRYSNLLDARVAQLPGSIGITVVNKDIKLPEGSVYLN
jgi:hypothetical protein